MSEKGGTGLETIQQNQQVETRMPRRQQSPKGSRPYVLESAEYGAQLRSTKADIEAQLGILEGEAAGIAHRIEDLTRILNSVNAGLVPIEEPQSTDAHAEQRRPLTEAELTEMVRRANNNEAQDHAS